MHSTRKYEEMIRIKRGTTHQCPSLEDHQLPSLHTYLHKTKHTPEQMAGKKHIRQKKNPPKTTAQNKKHTRTNDRHTNEQDWGSYLQLVRQPAGDEDDPRPPRCTVRAVLAPRAGGVLLVPNLGELLVHPLEPRCGAREREPAGEGRGRVVGRVVDGQGPYLRSCSCYSAAWPGKSRGTVCPSSRHR